MQIPQSVLAMLERGGLVVTANARAARELRRLYGELRARNSGRWAWASPAVLEWHGWLASRWQRLLLGGDEDRLLLSALQEESVWQGIVRPVVASRSLVSPGEVARLAQRAYARLVEYGGADKLHVADWEPRGLDQELQETELFRRWALAFERLCERRGWMPAAMLPWLLADGFRQRRLEPPREIAWSGFDRVTPANSALRRALEDAGCTQHESAWGVEAQQRRLATQTVDDEVEACAAWVRAYLEKHPGARIGVLVEDVRSMRAQIDCVFRRVLMPRSCGLLAEPEAPVYEFTLGIRLAEVPMVRAALLLLRWLSRPLEQEQISWLLTTGFFGDGRDAGPLAEADARLRHEELLPPEEGMDAFLRRLERTVSPLWLKRMRRAQGEMRKKLAKEQSSREWVVAIDAALSTAGWPGSRFEDSVNYQVHKRWQRMLEEMATLDFNDARSSYDRFLDQMTGHAEASIFSAESEEAPVSISGVLESAGRAFDAVWMLQATDVTWPAKSSAAPLLPAWLQKELEMPRGDAEEDWRFGAAVTDRLRASTQELIFSYAREGAAGAQRASALIAHLAEEMITPVLARPALLTDRFEDDASVAWPGGERTAGGQGVLKKQAACPFQAFADRRLGGRELRSSEHGLDPLQRGKLVHRVLETLWMDSRMQDSAGLRAMIFRGELEACIAEHVQQALAKYRARAGSWESAYLALEEQRLCQLVQGWLAYESGRKDFVVEKVEAEQEIAIEGLRLNVRMDRIDLVKDGRVEDERVLIDYKTGAVKAKQWFGDRPEEPQLPLYAIAGNVEALRDVYFAQLRRDKERPDQKGTDKPQFVGALTGDASRLFTDKDREDLAETFAAMRAAWRQALGALSRDFQAGVAAVDPKDYPATCKFCAFSGLCRVKEVRASLTDDVDEFEVEDE